VPLPHRISAVQNLAQNLASLQCRQVLTSVLLYIPSWSLSMAPKAVQIPWPPSSPTSVPMYRGSELSEVQQALASPVVCMYAAIVLQWQCSDGAYRVEDQEVEVVIQPLVHALQGRVSTPREGGGGVIAQQLLLEEVDLVAPACQMSIHELIARRQSCQVW
jgi:hypothetical protein